MDAGTEQALSWSGLALAAVLGGGVLFKNLVVGLFEEWKTHRQFKRELHREEKTTEWHQKAERVIALENEAKGSSERERQLLERLIQSEREKEAIRKEADKQVALAAAVIKSWRRRDSDPVSSSTTQPRSRSESGRPMKISLPAAPLMPSGTIPSLPPTSIPKPEKR